MNSAQNKLADLAAQTVVRHVKNGGWLGASWPNYTCGWLDQPVLDEAITRAEKIMPDLWECSKYNFESGCAQEFAQE